jgi:hypothetical protein
MSSFSKIIGDIATEWKMSPDRRTYTFDVWLAGGLTREERSRGHAGGTATPSGVTPGTRVVRC